MCRSRCRRVAKIASAVPWPSDHRHGPARTGGPPLRAYRHSPVPQRPHRGPYSRRPSWLRRSSLRQRVPLDSVAPEQFQTASPLLRGQHSQLERRRWLCNEFVTQCRAVQLAPESPVHDLWCGRSAELPHVCAGQGKISIAAQATSAGAHRICPASLRDQDHRARAGSGDGKLHGQAAGDRPQRHFGRRQHERRSPSAPPAAPSSSAHRPGLATRPSGRSAPSRPARRRLAGGAGRGPAGSARYASRPADPTRATA